MGSGISPPDEAALQDTASSPSPSKQAQQAAITPPSSKSKPGRKMGQGNAGLMTGLQGVPQGASAGAAGSAKGPRAAARKALWLRLEWNQISLTHFMKART